MFLVHGDYDTMVSYKEKLLDNGFRNIYIPEKGETVTLEKN
jgi:hypothetical protein